MRIAIPTEVKNSEFRVAITPAGVHDLSAAGHEVKIQKGAGAGSSIPDSAYEAAGATMVADADALWAAADLVLKVKEPVESEYRHFREDLVLFTYLHLAADEALTRALLEAGVTAIAYETVQLPDRSLPLLAPMSEVAGRLSAIVGANTMLKPNGGPGLLVPGVPGTHPAKVSVLGGGVAGSNAAAIALGLGARVTVLDTNLARLRELDEQFGGRVVTIASNAFEIEHSLVDADLVIGSVLVPGARTPKLVSNDLVSRMRPGSALVDIAVDQGGCFEDSHPTTHDEPTFTVHGLRVLLRREHAGRCAAHVDVRPCERDAAIRPCRVARRVACRDAIGRGPRRRSRDDRGPPGERAGGSRARHRAHRTRRRSRLIRARNG